MMEFPASVMLFPKKALKLKRDWNIQCIQHPVTSPDFTIYSYSSSGIMGRMGKARASSYSFNMSHI
jgi:hypothetical protein